MEEIVASANANPSGDFPRSVPTFHKTFQPNSHLTEYRPDVPEGLDTLFRDMVAKRPEEEGAAR